MILGLLIEFFQEDHHHCRCDHHGLLKLISVNMKNGFFATMDIPIFAFWKTFFAFLDLRRFSLHFDRVLGLFMVPGGF